METNPHRTESHHLSEKQSNTEQHKVATAIAAVTDPKFPLPHLTSSSSPLRYILSFATLAGLIAVGLGGAWYLELELLTVSGSPVVVAGVAFVGVLGALFLTGSVWIDWFELVVGYWWLSLPIGALGGLVLVLHQEGSQAVEEVA